MKSNNALCTSPVNNYHFRPDNLISKECKSGIVSWNPRGHPLYKCGQGRANKRYESLFRTGRGMRGGITKYLGIDSGIPVLKGMCS